MAALVDRTFDQLLELVITGKAGTTIPNQDELAARFEVSRTVVREALSRLEHLRVVSIQPRTGTVINEPSKWKIVNVDVIAWRMRAGETIAQLLDSISTQVSPREQD